MIAPLVLAAARPATMRSTPRLGVEEGRCRPGEHGPAMLIAVEGLKDRTGEVRAEVYPARDGDFLADDTALLSAGKVFRRAIVAPLPAAGPIRLCVRVPAAGTYALAVIHARTGHRGFSLLHDGIGFGNNPHLGYGKPKAITASIAVGPAATPVNVVMNYRIGLISFGPLGR